MENIGTNQITERHQFFLDLSRLGDWPKQLALPSRYFGLFLACDARAISDEAIVEVAGSLIEQGIVYLCSWGPDCERVHDLFDSVIVERNPNETEKSVILTTWHDGESLDEALWHFLNVAFPAQMIIGMAARQSWR